MGKDDVTEMATKLATECRFNDETPETIRQHLASVNCTAGGFYEPKSEIASLIEAWRAVPENARKAILFSLEFQLGRIMTLPGHDHIEAANRAATALLKAFG